MRSSQRGRISIGASDCAPASVDEDRDRRHHTAEAWCRPGGEAKSPGDSGRRKNPVRILSCGACHRDAPISSDRTPTSTRPLCRRWRTQRVGLQEQSAGGHPFNVTTLQRPPRPGPFLTSPRKRPRPPGRRRTATSRRSSRPPGAAHPPRPCSWTSPRSGRRSGWRRPPCRRCP